MHQEIHVFSFPVQMEVGYYNNVQIHLRLKRFLNLYVNSGDIEHSIPV